MLPWLLSGELAPPSSTGVTRKFCWYSYCRQSKCRQLATFEAHWELGRLAHSSSMIYCSVLDSGHCLRLPSISVRNYWLVMLEYGCRNFSVRPTATRVSWVPLSLYISRDDSSAPFRFLSKISHISIYGCPFSFTLAHRLSHRATAPPTIARRSTSRPCWRAQRIQERRRASTCRWC